MITLIVVAIIGQTGVITAAIVAGVYAKRAAASSKPTGNGFADVVKKALVRIEGKVDRHIETHANEGMKKR